MLEKSMRSFMIAIKKRTPWRPQKKYKFYTFIVLGHFATNSPFCAIKDTYTHVPSGGQRDITGCSIITRH